MSLTLTRVGAFPDHLNSLRATAAEDVYARRSPNLD